MFSELGKERMIKDMVEQGVKKMAAYYNQLKKSGSDKALKDDGYDDDMIFLGVNVSMPIIVDLSCM